MPCGCSRPGKGLPKVGHTPDDKIGVAKNSGGEKSPLGLDSAVFVPAKNSGVKFKTVNSSTGTPLLEVTENGKVYWIPLLTQKP